MAFFKATTFLCIVYFLTLNHPVGAQAIVNKTKPDARSISLGGSLVVQAHDPVAIYWNPALLAGLKDRALSLSMENLYEYSFLGFTQFIPLYGTFGFSLARIPAAPDTTIETGSLVYGRKLSKIISFGAGLNIQKKENEIVAASRLGFFLGNPAIGTPEFSWRSVSVNNHLDRVSLGLTFQNVPLSGNFFETSAMVGLGYLFPRQGLLLNTGYHFSDGDNTTHLGLGYELTNLLTLTAGIEDFDTEKFGAGVNFSYDNFSVQLTYGTEFDKFLLTAMMRIGGSPLQTANRYLRRGDKFLVNRYFEAASEDFKKYLSYDYEEVNRDSLIQMIYALDRKVQKNKTIVNSMLTQVKKMLSEDDPQFLRAALMLRKVLELEPGNEDAGNKLKVLQPAIDKFILDSKAMGKLRFGTHNYLEAKRMFSRVLMFDKNDPEANYYVQSIDKLLVELADQYFENAVESFEQKRYQMAKAEIDLALEHNPEHEGAKEYRQRITELASAEKSQLVDLLEKGEQLERNDKYVDAANAYLQVLDHDPNNKKAREKLIQIRPKVDRFLSEQNNEAVRHFSQGNINKAMSILDMIISIDPNHKEAKSNIIKVRRERNRLVNTYVQRGDSLFALQKYKAAQTQFNKALELQPNHNAALQGVLKIKELNRFEDQVATAQQLGREGKYLEAFNLLQKLVAQNPGDQKAQEEFAAAEKEVVRIADNHFNQGIKFYTEDNYEDAIKEFNLVLQYDPQHEGAVDYIKRAQERLQALRSFGNSR